MSQNTISARTVPLDRLALDFPGWLNPREFTGLGEDDVQELGQSIKTKGIVDALKVVQLQLGKSADADLIELVIDGQRRVISGRDVLPKSAPIPVVDLTDEPMVIENPKAGLTPDQVDWLLVRAFTTLEREGLSSYELTNAAKRWKDRGKTGEWIGNVIHKHPSWVSKMLKAFEAASPKLKTAWRKGEITDEQFKELAEVKDPEKQQAAAKEVVEARKSGDKTEARVRAKEIKETERQVNGHNKKPTAQKPAVKPAVAGGQLTFDGKEEKPAAPKRNAPSKIILEDMIAAADKRPPTSDYVKGLMDGVRYALGIVDPSEFAKPWVQYMHRLEGRPRPAKKTAKAKAPKVKKTAKARKPAKKSKAKRSKR